jgi:hypothetical protein
VIERNVGGRDRTVRAVLAVALAGVGLATVADLVSVPRLVGPLALAGAASLGVNALTGRCLANHVLGVDTCRVDPD